MRRNRKALEPDTPLLVWVAILGGWWLVVMSITALAMFVVIPAARGQQHPNCEEFGFRISTSCCCTANCCAEANEREFEHIGDDNYRSTVTGQVLKRTGWSPDGRFIRCACDLIDGTWKWHPHALVRCVYPPMPAS